jgi:hypothetical protein
MTRELLPDDLLWSDDGHVSDVVLTALADAQHDIVPAKAIAHTESCPACAQRLGNAALLSLRAGELLDGAPGAGPARAPVPVAAVFAGIVLAALGAAPGIVQLPGELTQRLTSLSQTLHLLAKNAGLVLRAVRGESGPLWTALTFGSAALLLLAAFGVMKLAPRQGVSR